MKTVVLSVSLLVMVLTSIPAQALSPDGKPEGRSAASSTRWATSRNASRRSSASCACAS